MDGFNEKKWFVYLNDHHEGPFSLAEIQEKMTQSQVTSANYVWCEGMGDWKAMTEVTEFESVLGGREDHTVMAMGTPAVAAGSGAVAASSTPAYVPPKEEKTGDMDAKEIAAVKAQAAAQPKPVPTLQVRGGERIAPKIIKLLFWLLFPVGIAAAYIQGYLDPVLNSSSLRAGIKTGQELAQPYLLELADKAPMLGKWISPIPSLDDVLPEEYEELKIAAGQKPESGYKLAIAQSQADVLAPAIYVASNLPDGAVIDLYVQGIPDTLLNQLGYATRAQATISKKLGKTPAIRFNEGKALPRGQYMIYAIESDKQPPAVRAALNPVPPATGKVPAELPKGFKLLASKAYFLGGAKDGVYAARLKEFHDKLRAKAQSELAEVKQFATTVDSQLGLSVAKYNQLHKGKKLTAAQRKAWNDFHTQWSNLDGQMNLSFQKWTPVALQSEYFYGALYQLVIQAGQAADQVHGYHHSYFTGAADPKSFDIQLGTAMSLAQNAIAALKAKIDQAEKLAPTPNGMPRRDGL